MCNYVFEYERRSASHGGGGGGPAPALAGALVVVAAVALIAGFAWARSEPALADNGGVGLVLVPAGLFSLAGALFDWSWFFGARKARLIAAVLGRTGARVAYAGLGGGLAGAGLALALA